MPLPITADSLDAIPEAARGAYTEKGGKFVLDAEFEDVAGLKATNAKLIEEKRALAARAKVIGDRTPEDVQADLEFAAKMREQKAKDEGNFEELKKIQAAEKAKLEAELASVRDGRKRDRARQVATEAIVSAGGKPKKLLDPVLRSIKVIEQDGELIEQVVDGKGNVRMTDGQGTPMTVAQLVEEFKADDDYAVDFAPSGAAGSGARNAGGGSGNGGTVIIPKDADVMTYRRLKAEAEKRGVPYQVAS